MGHYLVFDTETNGLPAGGERVFCVQLAWEIWTWEGDKVGADNYLIYPEGWTIPKELTAIHGISTEMCRREGRYMRDVLDVFFSDIELDPNTILTGHHVRFDMSVVGRELQRHPRRLPPHWPLPTLCTMEASIEVCRLLKRDGKRKWPKLQELHKHLFGVEFASAHRADADVAATVRCFWELKQRGLI